MKNAEDAIRAVVVGHAVADALGVPVEFLSRRELAADPVLGMRGFGSHPVPAGTWSDDTTMAIAALDVLADGRVDYRAIMQNFADWYAHGAYTATGVTFDIGGTCAAAIRRFTRNGTAPTACGPREGFSNGNGSLMRIHPFVLMAYCQKLPTWEGLINDASSLTHGHERACLGCRIYTEILLALLDAPEKSSVIAALKVAEGKAKASPEVAHYARLFAPGFAALPESEIKSTGYVVDTLEAAVWCLLTTDSYAACVLRAVNLGEDTDTVAAVAGGLAGALYGYAAIPAEWRQALLKRDYIEEMCTRAARTWRPQA